MNLKDIAQIANVSSATVSMVLNNKPGVGQDKRKEIKKLLKEHYRPQGSQAKNISIRSLYRFVFVKHVKNGFLVEENSGFISTILDSIEIECRKHGCSLQILVSQNNLDQTLKSINLNEVDGAFILGSEFDASDHELLKNLEFPYVVIDNRMPYHNCNSITMDNDGMFRDALMYLHKLGFAEIAYFKSKMTTQNFKDRADAFFRYCPEFNLHYDDSKIFPLEPTIDGAYKDLKRFLSAGIKLPACAIADNDSIAIGAIKALKEFKYSIPKDIALIGFDDIHFSKVHTPSLSTLKVEKKVIGELAVRSLLYSIRNPNFRNIKQLVGGSLILRDSTPNSSV